MYPFAVYIGLNNLSPSALALILIALVLMRVFLARSNLKKLPWLVPASLLGVAAEKNISAQAIKYTANVTLVWCLFFTANGLVSLYTALFTPLDIWMIYNGFISYILMALLMLVEYLVRLKVKKKHQLLSAQSTKASESAELHE